MQKTSIKTITEVLSKSEDAIFETDRIKAWNTYSGEDYEKNKDDFYLYFKDTHKNLRHFGRNDVASTEFFHSSDEVRDCLKTFMLFEELIDMTAESKPEEEPETESETSITITINGITYKKCQ